MLGTLQKTLPQSLYELWEFVVQLYYPKLTQRLGSRPEPRSMDMAEPKSRHQWFVS